MCPHYYLYTEIPEIEVHLSSSPMVFDLQEDATLQCTAVGGDPAIHNISLVKNDQVLDSKALDEIITYTTSGGLPRDIYGLYGCNVSNSSGAVLESNVILLQHKGDRPIPCLCSYFKFEQ